MSRIRWLTSLSLAVLVSALVLALALPASAAIKNGTTPTVKTGAVSAATIEQREHRWGKFGQGKVDYEGAFIGNRVLYGLAGAKGSVSPAWDNLQDSRAYSGIR